MMIQWRRGKTQTPKNDKGFSYAKSGTFWLGSEAIGRLAGANVRGHHDIAKLLMSGRMPITRVDPGTCRENQNVLHS